jgi:hypothetical protein
MKKIIFVALILVGLSTQQTNGQAFLADSLTCSIFGTAANVQFTLYLRENGNGTDSFWMSLVRDPVGPAMTFQTSGNTYMNIVTPVAIGNMVVPTATPMTVYGVRGQCNNLSATSYLKIRVSQALIGAGAQFGYVFLNVAWSHGGGSYNPYQICPPYLHVTILTPPWAIFPWLEGLYSTAPSKITQVQADLNISNYVNMVSSTPLTLVDTTTIYWGKMYNQNNLLQWRRDTTHVKKCSCGN